MASPRNSFIDAGMEVDGTQALVQWNNQSMAVRRAVQKLQTVCMSDGAAAKSAFIFVYKKQIVKTACFTWSD